MEQTMITLTTDMQFSKERLKEIFEVPKTKELFDKFMSKEETSEWLKDLTSLLDTIFDEEELEVKDIVIQKVQVAILAKSIQLVINGKPLNQAIQVTLKEQIKEESILAVVEQAIGMAMPGILFGAMIAGIL